MNTLKITDFYPRNEYQDIIILILEVWLLQARTYSAEHSPVQLQVRLTTLGGWEAQVPHVSVETDSSSSKGDFRAPKLDSLSESPSQGASLCSLNISPLWVLLFSLCQAYSVGQEPTHGMCQKEKKGRERKADSHTGIMHRGTDRAARHSCKAQNRWIRKAKKK